MAAPAATFESISSQIAKGAPAPVYLLHGEEGFYIDELVKKFENLVPEADRDFNLYVFYAPEVQPETVTDACMRYPMMADRQVVILKEAQAVNANYIDKLTAYASRPNPTTVFVVAARGAAIKGRTFAPAVQRAGGVVFQAKRVDSRKIDSVIADMLRQRDLRIEPKGLSMLRDYVGSDLSRLYNEIGKLLLVLGQGATVTPEAIERNIGISKDFNNFELVDAIARHDAATAFRITEYFRSNPKNNPSILTVTQVFKFFQNLLIAQYTPDKSDSGLMAALGIKWPSMLTNYKTAMHNYKVTQVIEIIGAIRSFDTKAKGIGSRSNEFDLLRELMFRIFNAPGQITID